ncbi:hypothetical protein [Verrucosispora sp. WMMD573]|uniref:hypothetical protein n=1 Tax=Verrucosispora sp. WMMD573 TaxID=3015149 RepID=UPI00248BFBBF|nr:hypothetical protein [Verrucosispora sp. WMMD573]WBB53017.1 hypothetical protein O7601_20900 [Verrucosispora sp. WMMD573]
MDSDGDGRRADRPFTEEPVQRGQIPVAASHSADGIAHPATHHPYKTLDIFRWRLTVGG